MKSIKDELSKLSYSQLIDLLHEVIYPLMAKKSKKIMKKIGSDW